MENAALAATIPLARSGNKLSPTLGIYSYKERDYGVDIGAGAILSVGPFDVADGKYKIGPCSIATEVVWPGPFSVTYAQSSFSFFSERFSMKPMALWAKPLSGPGNYFGGRLSGTLRIAGRWSAEATGYALFDPSANPGEKLAMASWRAGIAAAF